MAFRRGAACGVALVACAACGPKPPPPHVTEVPIDQFQPTGPGPDLPASATAIANEPAVEAVVSSNAPSGNRPAPLTTSPPPGPAPDAVPAGQRLSPQECTGLLDKGAILYGRSKGMPAGKAARALATLRTQADADPTYAKVHSGCAGHVQKPQYQCAVKTTSLDEWKACLE
jgi:hypothetical protein